MCGYKISGNQSHYTVTEDNSIYTVTETDPDQFCDEYQSVYDSFYTKPNSVAAIFQNTMVESLVADGIWALMDVIYVHASHTNDNNEALINWKNPGVNDATIVLDGGTMNFTAYEGFQSDNGAYIDYGYNPNSEGVNFTQNSGSFGFYSRSNIAEAAYDMGMRSNTEWSLIAPRYSDNTLIVRLNDLSSLTLNIADSFGMHIVSRLSDSEKIIFKNKQEIKSDTSSSTGVPNYNSFGLAYNSLGVAQRKSTKQHSLHFWASGLTRTQSDNFTDAFESYMVSNDKSIITTNNIYVNTDGTQDYTTISSALASISDNTNLNRYNIYIRGTFNEYGLVMKNFVNIIGYGTSVSRIIGYLPADTEKETIRSTSTLDCDNIDFSLENLYVSIQNGRYAIHSDAGTEPGNITVKDQRFINVTAEHLGNVEADSYWEEVVWATQDALGMGLSDNMLIKITDGEYITAGTTASCRGIAIHGVSSVPALDSKVYITDSILRSGGSYVLRIGNLYPNQDKYYFTDVSMYGDLLIDGSATYTNNTTETGSDPTILNGNIISD